MSKNIFIKGLNSCTQRRINIDRYRDYLRKIGHTIVNDYSVADIVLIWTCGFRKDLRDLSLAAIEKYTKMYGKNVIACGCLPSIDKDAIESLGVPYFSWKQEDQIKLFFNSIDIQLDNTYKIAERPICCDINEYRINNKDKKVSFCDQFIKIYIAEGCKHQCTYCSEQLAFPQFRSFKKEIILDAAKKMIEKYDNYNIVLFSDSTGNYEYTEGNRTINLMDISDELLQLHPSIKIGYDNLNPQDFILYFDKFEDLFINEKIFYCSLPIQTTSDRLLNMMNRQYRKVDIEKIFTLITKYKFRELVTHLLLGFPTENDEDFSQTVDMLERYRPKYVLLSKYMEIPRLPSARFFPKISADIVDKRLKEAVRRLTEFGIICNYDDCDYMQEKFGKEQLDLGE